MAWAVCTMTLFMGFLYLFAIFLRLLREDHPDIYRRLGSPALIPKDPQAMDWRTARFLWRGEYRRVGDRRLTRVGHLLRLYTLLLGA